MKIFSTKKASTSSEVPIWLLFALLVVTFLVIILLRKAGGIHDLSECENYGGVVISESKCNEKFSNHFFPGDQEEYICCRKKSSVSEEAFKNWSDPIKIVSTESGTGGIPVIVGTSGTQERVNNTGNEALSGNELRLTFNGKTQPAQGMLTTIQNTPFVISATHNIEEGNFCKLYVVEAQRSGSGYSAKRNDHGIIVSLNGMSYTDTNCAPNKYGLAQLQIDNKIAKAGMYKADFIVKKSPNAVAISSRSIIFEVKEGVAPVNENAVVIPPTITVAYTQDSRGKKIHCWVDIDINSYGQELEHDFEVYSAKTDTSCLQASYQPHSYGNAQTIAPDKYLCLRVEQQYKDAEGVERVRVERETFTVEQCDEVKIYAPEQSFSVCTQSCEELSNADCVSRTGECEFSLDCSVKKPLPLLNFKCVTCDSSYTSCASYRNKDACEANQCLQNQRCEWKTGFPKGKCVPYDIDLNTQ